MAALAKSRKSVPRQSLPCTMLLIPARHCFKTLEEKRCSVSATHAAEQRIIGTLMQSYESPQAHQVLSIPSHVVYSNDLPDLSLILKTFVSDVLSAGRIKSESKMTSRRQ